MPENANDGEISLDDGLRAVHEGIELFFSNKFEAARKLFSDLKHCSVLHSGGLCYVDCCICVFTAEKPHIEAAYEQSKYMLNMLTRYRRRASTFSESLTGLFRKPDYGNYTDMEAHTELMLTETYMMSCIVNFMQDQSIFSLARSAKYMYSAYNAIRIAVEIHKAKKKWNSDISRENFDCGVNLMWGMVSVLMSHLPARFLKIVSFVGFKTEDRAAGMKALRIATETEGCIRTKAAGFIVCFYTFYLEQFFGLGEADMEWIKEITERTIEQFPTGAFGLFFSARYHQIRGDTTRAIQMFNKSISVQSEFQQMHNVCRWDLLWCYAMQCDWNRATEVALSLRDSCQWSPATNAYQAACFLYTAMKAENRPELRTKVDEAMASVEALRTRYGGKTLPPEKYAIEKSKRYLAGETDPVLPALQLFYVWNIFGNCKDRPELMEPLLAMIDKEKSAPGDGRFIVQLLKGVCLRNANRPDEALECFQEIVNNEDLIKVETYIPPHAAMELGLTFMALGAHKEARMWLLRARDNYTGFLVEALVHLRIHGALQKLERMERRSLG